MTRNAKIVVLLQTKLDNYAFYGAERQIAEHGAKGGFP